jgi:glutamate-1-semialdehyde aminotransferase
MLGQRQLFFKQMANEIKRLVQGLAQIVETADVPLQTDFESTMFGFFFNQQAVTSSVYYDLPFFPT